MLVIAFNDAFLSLYYSQSKGILTAGLALDLAWMEEDVRRSHTMYLR